jgi:hypothetical protein
MWGQVQPAGLDAQPKSSDMDRSSDPACHCLGGTLTRRLGRRVIKLARLAATTITDTLWIVDEHLCSDPSCPAVSGGDTALSHPLG